MGFLERLLNLECPHGGARGFCTKCERGVVPDQSSSRSRFRAEGEGRSTRRTPARRKRR